MAADTFGWVPDFGGSVDVTPRIRSVSFGDGYTQSVPDGINNLPETRSLTFANRDTAEINAIEAFLVAHAGVIWFWYQHPGRAAIQMKCEKWQRTDVSAGFDTLTCTFQQVYYPS